MSPKIIETQLNGVYIIEPHIFKDDRGYFYESFNLNEMKPYIRSSNFVQDNESLSHKGVFRGFHLQSSPYQQSKLIRVTRGSIIDFVLDINPKSKTFKRIIDVKLDDVTKNQLYIPGGYAHGFIALEDNTIVHYKVDNYYSPKHEICIKFDDPELSLNLNNYFSEKELIISKKDRNGKLLSEII